MAINKLTNKIFIMSIYSKDIIKFIDNELNENEKMKFMNHIEINKELSAEYKLHLEIDKYMKSKFLSEEFENDINLCKADNSAKDIIADHIMDDTEDTEIKEYIRNSIVDNKYKDFEIDVIEKEKINVIEKEIAENGIDKIVTKWIEEETDSKVNKKYNREISDFINSVIKEEDVIKAPKDKPKFDKFKIVSRKRIKRIYYYVSAAAAVLIIVFVLWRNIFSGVSKTELFSENYTPPEFVNNEIIRGETKNIKESLLSAASLYNNKQFSEASLKFEEVIDKGEKKAGIYIYCGICRIEEGNYKEAVKNFDYVINNFDNYRIEAMWYKGLCYLKTDKIIKAINQFEKIAEINCTYQENSKAILEELYKIED